MKFIIPLISFWQVSAWAENPAPAAGPAGGVTPFIPIILIFGIFYFLVIRPQQRKMKDQQKFLQDLKKGDMVITNGGIVGLVKQLSDKIITLEIDEGVCLKVLRNQILESANTLKQESKPA